MSEKHTVAVVAATGAQGRSVALHFLKSPERYSVRALVRNTSSDVATQLKQKGAELHTATLDDTSALQRAFRGAEAVFAYTAPQTWGAPDPSKPNETQLGKNIVDACGKEGVKWLAWTSCPSAEKYSNGAMSIPTYEEKRAVDEYIRETKTPGTILMLGGFLENVLNFGWLKKDAQSDTLALNTPLLDASLPQAWTSVSHDLGPIVETVFSNALGWSGRKANPTKWQHREVNTCFGWPSTGELKEAIAQQNNRPVQQNVASKEVLLKVAPHLAGALPIFELIRDYNTMPDPKDSFKRVQLPDQALTEEGLKLDTPQRWAKEDVGAFLDSGA